MLNEDDIVIAVLNGHLEVVKYLKSLALRGMKRMGILLC